MCKVDHECQLPLIMDTCYNIDCYIDGSHNVLAS